MSSPSFHMQWLTCTDQKQDGLQYIHFLTMHALCLLTISRTEDERHSTQTQDHPQETILYSPRTLTCTHTLSNSIDSLTVYNYSDELYSCGWISRAYWSNIVVVIELTQQDLYKISAVNIWQLRSVITLPAIYKIAPWSHPLRHVHTHYMTSLIVKGVIWYLNTVQLYNNVYVIIMEQWGCLDYID